LAEQVLELDPLSIVAHRRLADMYARFGRQDDALEVYRAGLRVQPDTARIHGRIARIYLLRGGFETAAEHIAREPVKWVRNMYTVILDSRGEDSEALQTAAKTYEETYGVSNSYQLAEI
jgi:tetratricopeptide (TPR) repeat protein